MERLDQEAADERREASEKRQKELDRRACMPYEYRVTAILKDPTVKFKSLSWAGLIGSFKEGEYDGHLLESRISEAMCNDDFEDKLMITASAKADTQRALATCITLPDLSTEAWNEHVEPFLVGEAKRFPRSFLGVSVVCEGSKKNHENTAPSSTSRRSIESVTDPNQSLSRRRTRTV